MSKLYILNGPETGHVFEIKDGVSYLGRAEDNDIRLADKTVSRKHLRIAREGDRYFITDLHSRNGTYCDGKYLTPGMEVEVRQGNPIAIGMSLIGIGKGCLEHFVPILDLVGLTKELGEKNGIRENHKEETNRKTVELLNKVSDCLKKNLSVRETIQEILRDVCDLLKNIDRAAFIVLDPETRAIRGIAVRSKRPADNISTSFCREVVARVLEEREPVLVLDGDAEDYQGLADTLETLRIKSAMCVPFISGSKMLGAIYVDSLERPYGFRKDDLCLLANLTQRTARLMAHARQNDTLSGLVDNLFPAG